MLAEGVFRAAIINFNCASNLFYSYKLFTMLVLKVTSVFYIVITLVSILYGSVFAAKKIDKKVGLWDISGSYLYGSFISS